jgi:hypothetical protein
LETVHAKEISCYVISLVICLGFLVWIMQLWSATLTVPFTYGGDAIFEGESIKGLIDTGGIYQNPYVGMPTGFLSYDYPTNCFLDFFIMKLISLVFPNWAMTMNLFFLLTFPLTTITTLFVFRYLKVSQIPAIIGSLLFTFVPFHFLRGELHLVLASYFLLPMMVLVLFWIFEDDFLLSRFKKGSQNILSSVLNVKSLLSIFICIGIALEFVYYPFFSCFFLLIAGICATISRKKWSPLLNAGLLMGMIVLCMIVSNIPAIMYQQDNGKIMEIVARNPAGSEIYGLKIIQLLLPVPGHRIAILSHISDIYAQTSPLVNENSTAALGIVGSVGFCILIIWVFYLLAHKDLTNTNEILKKISQLSMLNLSAVLLATIGGFGTVFAYLISPEIRCYNRISIFIAFFCIAAVVIVLDLVLQKYSTSKPKKWVIIGFIVVILFVGIYDQTTENFIPDYNNTKTTFISDQRFIQNIEETFPNDTLVFQLPYVPFPENPPVNKMADYDHFRAYLNSDNIHWSYGSMKGRDGDLWQKEIAGKSVNDMVDNLSFAGFNGIYVDSYGYADNGNEIISTLSSKLQITPLVSDNTRLYFFDMTKYNDQLKSRWSPEEFSKQKDRVLTPLKLKWQGGFSGLETSGSNTWRWCSSNGTLVVTNPSDTERYLSLNTTFFSGYPEDSQLKIESSNFYETIIINNSGYNYQNEFVIPPGSYTISFMSNAKQVDAPNDPRYLVFRLDHTQISERS